MATITGSNGADTLIGSAVNDTIDARRGAGFVDGNGGDDLLNGGSFTYDPEADYTGRTVSAIR
ncbi:MAG: hypothetical protein HRU33_17735 [Rhodobacteraceae bacterium]|nr:hypothetical protein [Paracoccaceae bacterium]